RPCHLRAFPGQRQSVADRLRQRSRRGRGDEAFSARSRRQSHPKFPPSHGESAYTGGAGLVTELFRPKNIYASPLVFRSPTYRDFQRTNHLRTEWKPPLDLGDRAGPWTVLHPAAEEHLPKAEDNALVLRGEIAGVSILLLSDLGRAGQRALLERTNNLRVDIAVTALPSESEPLNDMLLDAIQPHVIIIADA